MGCEMLAYVFGVEWFHTCFGHAFIFESDHKHLEQIKLKNIADMPDNLQRILLCLQSYDVIIKYCSGKEIMVEDALSFNAPPDAP